MPERTFISEEDTPAPVSVAVSDDEVIVRLADGRTIITPLVWYLPLLRATPEQRVNAVLGPTGIHWPDIDEDLSIAGMLAGVRPSYAWLDKDERARSQRRGPANAADIVHDGD